MLLCQASQAPLACSMGINSIYPDVLQAPQNNSHTCQLILRSGRKEPEGVWTLLKPS